MTRKHSTHDQDNPFILDPVARTWANAAVQKHNLIQRDHNSEVFTFKLPRFIEGHDMSDCDAVEVHFINIDAVTRKQSPGVYEVQDLRVNPEDSETITCSWVISRTATKYAGVLHFLLRFACYQEDGTEDYVWHSATDSSVVVAKGMNNGKAVIEAHVDILERWRQDLIESGGVSDQRIKTIVAEYMEEHPVETPGGVSSTEKTLLLSLLKNAVYTADMSATIAQLETLWSETPETPEDGVEQIGKVLSIVSGVTITQNGSVLAIA